MSDVYYEVFYTEKEKAEMNDELDNCKLKQLVLLCSLFSPETLSYTENVVWEMGFTAQSCNDVGSKIMYIAGLIIDKYYKIYCE